MFPRSRVLVTLVAGSLLGALTNSIVSVPVASVAAEFGASTARAMLIVSVFLVVFAVCMPVTGWLGDRYGQRRVYAAALVVLAVTGPLAALAPGLAFLVGLRAAQGVAAAMVLPSVLGLIRDLYDGAARARVIGVWAAANAIGQAAGPPLGGALTQWWGWRPLFLPIAVAAALLFVATLRWVPQVPRRADRLDRSGVALLVIGAAALLSAAVCVTLVTAAVPVGLTAAGIALLGLWTRHVRRAEQPLLHWHRLADPRFRAACASAFTQMCCFAAALVAVPLQLATTELGPATIGLIMLALPAAMAVAAPLVGVVTGRFGALPVARFGLAVIAAAHGGLAARLAIPALVTVLLLAGTGVALVQTPATTLATSSAAGRVGVGLGLFQLIRLGGGAVGSAAVAVAVAQDRLPLMYLVTAGLAFMTLVTVRGVPRR